MANVVEYIFSLQDQMSSKLQAISGSSFAVVGKLSALQAQSKKTSELLQGTGSSVGSLREKLNLLRNERDWLPQSNLNAIKRYNSEIQKLEGQIKRLDAAGTGGLGSKLSEAVNSTPIGSLLTNPIAQAGTALFFASKSSMSFDEGMAKINTTAQLSNENLSKLKDQLLGMGTEIGSDLNSVPLAFERILGQTNDVGLSTDILKTSLQGAKAGFSDVETVADALSKTLSIVGAENTNAKEVMDTLFASKRVGAGEFKDFATYIPRLVAGGKNLGLGFKEASGLFAYMTAKGNSAEASAMLLQNAFTALSKTDITEGLSKAGVNVFDKNGMMRDVGTIFEELSVKMASLSPKARQYFLEGIDLKDSQAKEAFSVLISDSAKLQETLSASRNASGELQSALERSKNPLTKLQELWSNTQYIAITLGGVFTTVLVPIFNILATSIKGVVGIFSTMKQLIQEGNLVFIVATTFIGSYILILGALKVATMISAFWSSTMTLSNIWQAASWVKLNTAMMMNPTALIIAGIIALIAVISYVVYKTDGWGKAWEHTVTGAKLIFKAFTESVKFFFNSQVDAILIGLNKIKEGWYSFKETAGIGDSAENQKAIAQIQKDTEERKKAITDGAKQIADLSKNSMSEFAKAGNSLTWNNKTLSDVTSDLKTKIGIEPPKLAGAQTPSDGTNLEDKKRSKAKQTNEAIATGGSKHNYITINLDNLIGVSNINANSTKEGINRMQEDLTDALLRTLGMATTTAG